MFQKAVIPEELLVKLLTCVPDTLTMFTSLVLIVIRGKGCFQNQIS